MSELTCHLNDGRVVGRFLIALPDSARRRVGRHEGLADFLIGRFIPQGGSARALAWVSAAFELGSRYFLRSTGHSPICVGKGSCAADVRNLAEGHLFILASLSKIHVEFNYFQYLSSIGYY